MSARLLPVYLWLLCFSVHHPHTHPLTPTDGWRGPLLTTPAPPRMSRASSAPPPSCCMCCVLYSFVLHAGMNYYFCARTHAHTYGVMTQTGTPLWILFPQPRPLKGHHVPQSGLRSTLGPDCSYKRGEHLQCCWNKVVDELKSSFAGVQHAHVDLYQSGV